MSEAFVFIVRLALLGASVYCVQTAHPWAAFGFGLILALTF